MELINGLSLVQKSAAGAAVVLLLALLIVIARRQRGAAKPADAATPGERRRRRRPAAEPKAEKVPRRRRRLADEAAGAMGPAPDTDVSLASDLPVHSMPGTEAELLTSTANDSAIAVDTAVAVAPELPVVEPVPVGAVSSSDPYVTPVASPGWPSPGELASGFDPDAFDPLPDQHHDDTPDNHAAYDETATATDDAVWNDEDTFDPATGWSAEVETPGLSNAPAIDLWTGDEATAGSADEPAARADDINLEDLWDDTDDLDDAVALVPEEDVLATVERIVADDANEVTAQDADDAPVDSSTSMDSNDSGDDWDDSQDTAVVWDSNDEEDPDLTVPFPAPGTIPTHDVAPVAFDAPGMSLGSHSNQIVLDLAALASGGQPVELFIEPSADGAGMRVRVGAIGTTTAHDERVADVLAGDDSATDSFENAMSSSSFDATDEEESLIAWANDSIDAEHNDVEWNEVVSADDSTEWIADAADVAIPDVSYDVPFLTGGFTPPATDQPEPTPTVVPSVDLLDDAPWDVVPEAPIVEVVADAEPLMDDDPDDPARILADIRARLAALDARRETV